MADVKLTVDQQKVVDAANCSLLVAAAAGSGKTAVLVKRIIERITDKEHPADVSRMLIVTFTRAAAAEMKDRIRKAIEEAVAANPSDLHLQQQSAAIINAQISTIDSFCMSVVRENFEELQIDPGFTTEDEAVGKLLEEDVLNRLFEDEYLRTAGLSDDPFRILVRSFGAYNSDQAAKSLVLSLLHAANNTPDPYEWLDSLYPLLDTDFSKSPLYDEMMAETERVVRDALGMNAKAASLCNEIGGPSSYLPSLQKDEQILNHIIEVLPDYEAVRERINVDYPPIGRKSKEDDPQLVEQVKGIRDGYKKVIEGLASDYFYCSLEKHGEMREKSNVALKALIAETKEFLQRMDAAKRDNNAYSFSDIAHMAYRILCVKKDGDVVPSETAKEMRKNYDAIMIDEYQDSSYLQEYILRSISGEYDGDPNLFMVGDVKQSIYSFRNARPELFNKKYADFTYDGDYRKIDLSMNFRSRKAVLDAVNIIMRGVMRADTAEIEYDKAAALYFGSGAYTDDTEMNDTEVILVAASGDEDEEEAPEDIGENDISLSRGVRDKQYDEAIATGRRILELMDEKFQVSDKPAADGSKRTRDLRYGDIAVLVPKNKNVSDRFINAFGSLGIPVQAENSTGFFGAVEIEKVMAFLRVLDNPYGDIPMAAVLYSDFAGFTAHDMAHLKACYGRKTESGHQRSLYEMVKISAGEGDEKACGLIALLTRMREEASFCTVHEIVEKLYEITGYKDAVTVLPGGDRRAANLDYLVSLAKKYENSSYAGLHDFLRYIDRLLERDEDMGEAAGDAVTDCVRICTIHKSKGLEYPVVFLCCSGGQFNLRESSDSVLIDERLGLVSVCVDTEKKVKQKTAGRVVMSHKKRRAAIAEKARNLYVALTRAREKLIIVGTTSNPEKTMTKAANSVLVNGALSYSAMSTANKFFDMILPLIFSGANDSLISNILENGSGVRLMSVDIEDQHFASTFRIKCVRPAADVKGEDTGEADSPAESVKAEDVKTGKVPESQENERDDSSFAFSPEMQAEIEKRKDYVYPRLSEAKAPMRVSVSELKHRAIDMLEEGGELQDFENPGGSVHDKNRSRKEADDSAKKGALRGTLYHEVFEKLQYTGDYSTYTTAKEVIKQEVDRLISEGFLPADIMDTVRIATLTAFVMSSIGQEMIAAFKAGKLHREQAFVYGLTPEDYQRLSGYNDKTDRVMIQGIIDAYFETPDGLVIVDYKTDHINSDAAVELTKKYRVQLELYGKALADITEKPVIRRVLYSVSKDMVIEV